MSELEGRVGKILNGDFNIVYCRLSSPIALCVDIYGEVYSAFEHDLRLKSWFADVDRRYQT